MIPDSTAFDSHSAGQMPGPNGSGKPVIVLTIGPKAVLRSRTTRVTGGRPESTPSLPAAAISIARPRAAPLRHVGSLPTRPPDSPPAVHSSGQFPPDRDVRPSRAFWVHAS